MPLTELEIRNAKPKEKPYKLMDSGWLFLLIAPGGSKLWRFGYRFASKQKVMALGAYPETGLKDARAKRDEAKAALADGIDPGEQRKRDKARAALSKGNTFNVVADELLAKKRRNGKAATTLDKNEWALTFARPTLGDRPIAEIDAAEVLNVLRQVEARGKHDTAVRLRALIGQVFRYAIATARAENDPTFALRGALTTPKTKHRPAIIDPAELGAFLRTLDGFTGQPETLAALRLLPLVFTRPGELRMAEWAEFDLEKGGLDDTRKPNEDAARASGSVVAAGARHPVRVARTHGGAALGFSRPSFSRKSDFRKHTERGAAAVRLFA
ncbi:hypothetical protein M2321_004179 [Rhodoblastus acidophilus]|jgi:hypothetical protein|nr:hypothetical protein [Rhodoblastus acidophilus]